MKQIYYILFLLFFASCSYNKKSEKSLTSSLDTIYPQYAKGFYIAEGKDYKEVTIVNPWKQGEVYRRYYLVADKSLTTPTDGKKITIPITSLVANSATYLEFLQMLDEIDKVTGVCNADYIYNLYIREKVKEKKIKDIGDSFNIDIENLLLLRPQAIMTTAYNADDENSKRLEQSGLSIIYNIEWQEKTPLGRAEWIKFIGAFFDKSQLADSLFAITASNYNNLKNEVAKLSYAPSIMSGQDFRGTWSMPGGESFNACFFRDAGANYFYSEDKTSGSISTNVENVLVNFRDTDIWVGAQAETLDDLGNIDSKYKLFKAYKNGKVYNYNNRMNETQGNDYWESAVAKPDVLLADLIKIIHPSILPEHELFYIKKLK